MNWQYNLFILIAIATSIFSCKPKENDSIKLQPDDTVGAFFLDDFSVKASSIQYDSSLSGDLQTTRHLAGVINNNEFGKVTSAIYSQINLPIGGFLFNGNAELLSCDLHLVKNYYFGVENEQIDLILYRLDEQLIFEDKEYYTFDNVSIGENYGEFSINNKTDSVVLPMPTNLARDIFDLAYENLENQEQLNKIFPGVTIQPYRGEGVVGFDVNEAYFRVHYIDNSDTTFADFYLNDEVAHFNRITYDRTGTSFSALDENRETIESSSLGDQVIIQAGTRVEGIINIDNFNEDYYNSEEAIYKAEIEIPVSLPDNYDVLSLDSTLLFIEINDTEETNRGLYSKYGDKANQSYTFDVTKEIQEVLSGAYELGDINLFTSQKGHSISSLIIDQPEENVKLKIYFNE